MNSRRTNHTIHTLIVSMYNKTFLCVITARGGSKGVKDKNIRLLYGKPMIAYVIEAAKSSGVFDKIVVTTDSEKIKSVAEVYGAEVIDRPSELAQDDSLVEDAVVHALQQTDRYDYILLLGGNCPLVIGRDILLASKKLLKTNADMVISVCKANPGAATVGRLGENDSMRNFIPKDVRICPRQQRPAYYYLNGTIYMGKWDIFAEKKDYYEQNTVAFIMHPEDSIDVDTEEDLIKVKGLLKRRRWAEGVFNG